MWGTIVLGVDAVEVAAIAHNVGYFFLFASPMPRKSTSEKESDFFARLPS